MPKTSKYLENDPLWYKDAVIYQLHVKTYYDGNGDGIGDFSGLTQKLDYLKSLGITAIWLLPFYPSPLKDDGYDISDYYNVHPQYGTLKDFKEFLKQAHTRGIRVITELVINHTSDEHPWFQKSRSSPDGSAWRDYYVWSDSAEKYADARIIFKDFETSNWSWDSKANAYYWHRFYSHQPDLNFENPKVQNEILKVADFWFGLGVDGLRLDAVPYLFEREGTNCENLPETYEFLRKMRKHIDRKFKNKMLLAEANQWPEDAVEYFGRGDECHMAFHFPLMPRMYMSLQMEDRFPVVDILDQTPPIPNNCQWAIFLRNHDELTLEMVTDEERDYMYRVYAKDPRSKINLGIRRRLVPLLGNDRKKIELMNGLLFSLTGTPIIYYGDEIGMGDNHYLGDRDGVRTPMQWSPDRNAGFSRVNPQQLYLPVIIDPEFHYETINVENQDRNLSSFLWWMRRVIDMRKKIKAFSRGSLEFLFPENAKVLAFIRRYGDEVVLVVVNLSRFCQSVELDLSEYKNYIPEEVFSQNKFPKIQQDSYNITLGPHNYYWLLLKQEQEKNAESNAEEAVPVLHTEKNWEEIFQGKYLRELEEGILPSYIRRCRWFGAKSSKIQKVRIFDHFPIAFNSVVTHLTLLEVSCLGGVSQFYLLPLSFAQGGATHLISKDSLQSIIAHVEVGGKRGVLYDGVYNEGLHHTLLTMIARRKNAKGDSGELIAHAGKNFKKLVDAEKGLHLSSHVLKAEQSNSSVIYEDSFFLKFFRKVEGGINPDAEVVTFLSEKKNFKRVPPFAGSIEYVRHGKDPIVLCMLQGYVPNQGDTWTYTLDHLGQYFERVLSHKKQNIEVPALPDSLLDVSVENLPEIVQDYIGSYYIEIVKLLGQRTAEMHLALSADKNDPEFAPDPFSLLYQRAVFQSMGGMARRVFQQLKTNIKNIHQDFQLDASVILSSEREVYNMLKKILTQKFSAMKIRIHGDYHLGQVLYTGKDFMIIDFEGEPARPLSERRLKKSPLRDVAGMIRSFHYAAYSAIFLRSTVRTEDATILEEWADVWYYYVSGIFLQSYLKTLGRSPLVPMMKSEFKILLQVFLLEKAIYELGYELNNRPEWVLIPLRGIDHILSDSIEKEREDKDL